MKSVGFTGVDKVSAVLYPSDKTPKRDTGEKKVYTYHERSATFLHPFQGVSPFLLWAFAPIGGGESGGRKWPSFPPLFSLLVQLGTRPKNWQMAEEEEEGGKQEVEEERKVAFWWSSLVGGKAGERPLGRRRGAAGRWWW